MSKQTEAQRLAENLPALFDNDLLDAVEVSEAAAELLRQEALIAELAEALKLITDEMEAGLPRSLGYEFTHIPKARAALAKVQQ